MDGDGDGDEEGEVEGEGREVEWDREGWRSVRGEGTLLRGQSRAQSRAQSRVQSRRGSIGGGRGEEYEVREEEEQEEIRPDFVNAEEENENQGEEVDEGEMKRVVMGRVGGWVDWAVGWMDFRGEGEEEEEEEESDAEGAVKGDDGGAVAKGGLDPVELQKRLRKKKTKDDEAESGGEGVHGVGSAPETAGLWSDAQWLVGVATKAVL